MTVPAAEYLRMSTEHQQYSLANQAIKIQEYANEYGFVVVKSYVDSGRSGVLLRHRRALSSLLADVVSRRAEFKAILVYDISRWGRFQDTDEAAHYEFLCRSAGIPVLYCAEPFNNDASVPSSIMKALKRTMAAEFSRELGVKVFAGLSRLVSSGFRAGGIPGYGMRRMLVSEIGQPKMILNTGEHKSFSKERTILVPGPENEQAVIRRIYELRFQNIGSMAIAERLNSDGIPFAGNRPWTYWSVLEVLRNPKYAGHNVWGTTDQKLYGPTKRVPAERWKRCDNAFQPIIDPEMFQRMQQLLDTCWTYTDEEMCSGLRKVLQKHGKISGSLIRVTKGIPCPAQYARRFGSLENAYRQIGYESKLAEFSDPERRNRSQQLRDELAERIASTWPARVVIERAHRNHRPILIVDRKIRVAPIMCPFQFTIDPIRRWLFDAHRRDIKADLYLACLLATKEMRIVRLFLLPSTIRRCRFKADTFEPIGVRLRKLSEFIDGCYASRLQRAETGATTS